MDEKRRREYIVVMMKQHSLFLYLYLRVSMRVSDVLLSTESIEWITYDVFHRPLVQI